MTLMPKWPAYLVAFLDETVASDAPRVAVVQVIERVTTDDDFPNKGPLSHAAVLRRAARYASNSRSVTNVRRPILTTRMRPAATSRSTVLRETRR